MNLPPNAQAVIDAFAKGPVLITRQEKVDPAYGRLSVRIIVGLKPMDLVG